MLRSPGVVCQSSAARSPANALRQQPMYAYEAAGRLGRSFVQYVVRPPVLLAVRLALALLGLPRASDAKARRVPAYLASMRIAGLPRLLVLGAGGGEMCASCLS